MTHIRSHRTAILDHARSAPGRAHAATPDPAEGLTAPESLAAVRHVLRQYDKAAKRIDDDLAGRFPSRAQLHRWLTGSVRSLPYPDHCRVLEEMFPGWTAEQLFAPCPPEHAPAGPNQRPGGQPAELGLDACAAPSIGIRPLHRAARSPRARHDRLRRILRRDPARRHPGTARQHPRRPRQAAVAGHPAPAARHHPADGPALPRRRPRRRTRPTGSAPTSSPPGTPVPSSTPCKG